jgi:BolA protein
MTMKERIERRLTEAFQPQRLDVIDESHKHSGHAGAREGGETHFRVRVVSDAFTGKRQVERHRLVYEALKAEMAERVHALALTTSTPEEA